jgi:hypothetical protein
MKFNLKKGSERSVYAYFSIMFYGIAIGFMTLSLSIPMFSNVFNLTIIIGSMFLIGGVLVSLLYDITKKIDKIPRFEKDE